MVIAGCAERSGYHRLGVAWTKERIAGARDPYLRARVPRERLTTIWASRTEQHRFSRELAAFIAALATAQQSTALDHAAATPAARMMAPAEEEETVP